MDKKKILEMSLPTTSENVLSAFVMIFSIIAVYRQLNHKVKKKLMDKISEREKKRHWGHLNVLF